MSNVIEVQFGGTKGQSMKAVQYVRDIEKTRPQPPFQKFAEFYKLCHDAAAGDFQVVIVAFPEVLGDSYHELIGNLDRAAEAGLLIAIAAED